MADIFRGFFSGKKVLVTGHTGFKGGWLSRMLLNFGAEVVGYSLKPDTEPNIFTALKLDKGVKNYFEDIRDYKKVFEVISKEKPDIVFHLAAQPLVLESYKDPIRTYDTNIIGTANVLEAIRECGKECGKRKAEAARGRVSSVKAAVMITTDKVYKNKEHKKAYDEDDELGGYDPYSASKACAEIVIGSYISSFFNIDEYGSGHDTLIASARSGNVIGGGDWSKDRLIPDIIKAVFEKDEEVIIRNPDSIRPWQHVLEPVIGYLMLAMNLYQGKKEFSGPWNFAPDQDNQITVEELVKRSLKILRKGRYSVRKEYAGKKHEAGILMLDPSKAKASLKWTPMLDTEKTLSWTFEWYKSFYSNEDIGKKTDSQITGFLEMFGKRKA